MNNLPEYKRRSLRENKEWRKDNQGKFLCHCGCNQEIQIKYFHKKRGIPKYINGHSSRDVEIKRRVISGLDRTRAELYLKNKGKHLSLDTEFKKGIIPWNKGKKNIFSEETLINIKDKKQGKHYSPKTEIKKGQFAREKHPRWKGGITPIYEQIRKLEESKIWRTNVFSRDNYTCIECGDSTGGNLNAHHINPFIKILNKFLQEYNQFSIMEDRETLVRLAINYKPFWDIDNGKTLCKNCHKGTKTCQNKN